MKTLLLAVAFLTISPVAAQNTPAQNTQNAPAPSPENYQKWMAEGKKLRTELAKGYSQYHAAQAVQTFGKAADVAPTSAQRGEAFIEGAEVLYSMAEMPLAINAFQAALKEQISPEMKGRALLGVARSEFHIAFMSRTLAKHADRLRANFETALKARKFTPDETRELWKSRAQISQAQGRHLQAAREFFEVVKVMETSHGKEIYGDDVTGELKKATGLSPAERSEAVKIADEIFKVLLPIKQKHGGAFVPQLRLDFASLWQQFGQNARAEKLWGEVVSDEAASQKMRTNAMSQIVQVQIAQGKYDVALQTLDGLVKISPSLETSMRFERAKVFMAQEKWSQASLEYSNVALKTTVPDEKAQAFLGQADVMEKQSEALKKKNAPAAEITAKLNMQKTSLFVAQLQTQASAELRRTAMQKLAQWETVNGSPDEAKKWEERAKKVSSHK